MSGKQNPVTVGGASSAADGVVIEHPTKADGAPVWRVARDSGTLDLNSSYAYLMWCQDFADTSVVARIDGAVGGFVMAYRKQAEPDVAVVWQVAVDETARGRGLGGRMLDALYDDLVADGVRFLEATITADNTASIALFGSFAERWNAALTRSEHFVAADFPDGHDAEDLYRIGPLQARHPR